MIYIVKHREYDNPVPKDHKELFVGDLFSDKGLPNINELNLYINELTGLYDIWVNSRDKIVGLSHYRRLFINNGDYVNLKDAEEILKEKDIIITPEVKFNMILYWQLRYEVENSDYLDKYLNMYYEKEPLFKDYIENHKGFSNREMFICKKELIDKYCKELFSIVLPITYEFIKEDYKHCNSRLISHIAERYFYYWVLKNALKVHNMEYKDI